MSYAKSNKTKLLLMEEVWLASIEAKMCWTIGVRYNMCFVQTSQNIRSLIADTVFFWSGSPVKRNKATIVQISFFHQRILLSD